MIVYIFCEDNALSELFSISVINTTHKNINHSNMFKNIFLSSNFEIINQKAFS